MGTVCRTPCETREEIGRSYVILNSTADVGIEVLKPRQ